MIPIGDIKVEQFVAKNKKRLDLLSKNILNRLKTIPKVGLSDKEETFLQDIIIFFEHENFFSVKLENVIKALGTAPTPNIKNLIFEKFEYESRRNDLLPDFFNYLGLKVCIYCHSQLALTFKGKGDKFKALLEADHYRSKNKYPYLSVSLFNLFPVCGNCNRNKGSHKVDFNLYSNDQPNDIIKFKIKDKSIIEDFLNFSATKLEFEISYNEDYINRFQLKEIYNTQIDIIEELVYKSKVYNNTYRENLKTYGIDEDTINRFIVGNYTSESDVYKRPLAKMMTDIAKDLDLIK
ncbi:hypothetical protein [Chryseobacterium sp. SIMBA_038]|uniref:hypothetical protein n=1 Tax=Chryseobacterium sp. SIMBA_038 TaxID=3085780 RepID=UPI00397DA84B